MSEQGGPYGPSGPGQPNQYAQGGPGQAPGGPQGWQQPNQPPTGPQGWQQPNQPPTGPQGWQQPNQPPTGPQGWQQPNQPPTGPQGWQQPNQPPTGPQGWQQPSGPQGWQGQQPPPTQSFPSPGGPGQPKKNNKPLIITAIAVVVALIAGAGVYWFAIRDQSSTVNTASSTGAGSPQEAVDGLVATLKQSDPIGLADQLDPAEAKLFTDLNADLISEFKRLEILSPAASADSMTGTTIAVSGLTYDPVETINDHISIVKLTGGTVTVTSDPTNLPFSEKIKTAFSDEISQAQPQTQTVNIADVVADNGGEPIRVATVKRDGGWYVSLFYTIADNAVHAEGLPNPTSSIPANGGSSPEDAVSKLISAATAADITKVIEVLPPDEMAVLHDYGQVLIDQSDMSDLTSGLDDAGVTIQDVQWTTSEVTGGTKVSLASITLTAEGETVSVTNKDGVLTVTVPGQPTITLDETTIDSFIQESAGTSDLDPQLIDIIKRELKQIVNLGFVTVKVDTPNGAQWFVSPFRTGSDVFVSLLRGLEPADIDYLITLAGK